MPRNSYRTSALADYRCRIWNSAYFLNERLITQLIQQRLGILEIGAVEAFGEPVGDFGQHGPCLVTAALGCEQPGEAAGGRAQLPPFWRSGAAPLRSLRESIVLLRLTRSDPRAKATHL